MNLYILFLIDNPCQGPTKKGFGNQFEHDEYGFVTYLEMGDGETFSSCWSMEFYASSLSQMGFYRVRVLQIAFYHHYITSDEACIQVVIIDRLLHNLCLFVTLHTRSGNLELYYIYPTYI